MKIKSNYIFITVIIFLVLLLISGYQLNKESSASKKNEISNIVQQLKTRNNQIAKIQKNLFKEGSNINDLINQKEINFRKIFANKKLNNLNNFLFSKYTTKDILFNGNRGATGTGFIDFYNKDEKLLLVTYDGIFAYSKINSLTNFKKISSNINSLIQYFVNFHFYIQSIWKQSAIY